MGQFGEPAGQLHKISGRQFLPQSGEADQIGEGRTHHPGTGNRHALGPLAGVDGLGFDRVPQLERKHVLDHRPDQRRGDARQRLRSLGDLQLADTGSQHRTERGNAHLLGGT